MALTDSRLAANADFQDFANLTNQIAIEKYGASSAEQQAVQKGWAQVGITVVGNGNPGDNTSPGCPLSSLLALFKPSDGNSGR
jgi:hypothetical protein